MLRGVALLLVLLTAVVARAESPAEREARMHYTAGQKSFDQAAYAQALEEFQKAYDLSRYPAILYKIALCRDQLGQAAEAIDAYQKYLEADPQSQRKAGIEARITQLQALSKPAPPPPPEPKPEVKPQPELVQTAPPPEPKKTPVYKKWWLWTIVGVVVAGGVATGVGIALAPPRSPTPDSFMSTLGRVGPGLTVR
jgi:tetratricopeptide (TPR) repeat protein